MRYILLAMVFVLVLNLYPSANAGVFDLPSFVEPGKWSAGIEPEIIISSPTSLGFNFKPRYGVNEILNWEGIVGAGTGSHNFRMGLTADLEWFPDIEKQPGIATPLTVQYIRTPYGNILNYGASPMIYKTFEGDNGDFTPFIAFPIGWNLKTGKNESFMQTALGSMFSMPGNDSVKFTLEAGFEVKRSFSYLAGGVTYFQSNDDDRGKRKRD